MEMKKKYLLSVLLTTTLLTANPVGTEVNGTEISNPEPPKTKEVKEQEFRNLTNLIAKLDRLSDAEKKNRLNLEKAKRNYGEAMENFQAVLDIKDLITNIHENEDCYVAYYRIKDLNGKIKSGSTDDIKVSIYTEMKDPLQTFLSNCRNLRLDLLEKYKK